MPAEYIPLDYGDLALAAVLVLLNAGLSLWLQLTLERQILIAAIRMVVQLALIAIVLKTLFALVSPLWTGLAALAMVLFAGREAMARQERPLAGWWSYGVGTSCILFAAIIVTIFALATQVRPDPWYNPRYAIPLLGMVLGNTMTGVALGLNTLISTAVRERVTIEARIALGADRWTAFRTVLRTSLRSGLIPITNQMAAAGLVSLPGMMTGQILAGADPVEAVKYQVLIMFLIGGAVGLGVLAAVFAGARRMTDDRHRLRLDRVNVRATEKS